MPQSDDKLRDALDLCREAGVDPHKPAPSLQEICDLMLAAARRSGLWRNAGIAIFEQLDSLGENNADKYCAICLALGLATAKEPRVGPGILFAAPLVAKALLSGD